MPPSKNRNDYRAMPTTDLREEAVRGSNVDWQELAIALAERLDTIRREVYDEIHDD